MSTFGRVFRVTTFGESHCHSVGCIVDGVPPRVQLTEADIQPQLTRRRPGQSAVSTKRNEADEVKIMSGTERGLTLGTPIGAFVRNKDMRPGDYAFQADEGKFVPRPSHADLTYRLKYGIHSSSGGGRSSARETIGRVIGGGIAEAFFKQHYPSLQIVAWTSSVGDLCYDMPLERMGTITRDEVDTHMTRCPDPKLQEQMSTYIQKLAAEGDSVGGTVTCVVRGVPVGLGEPAFDKLEALLGHAMMSIPATKGFEIGSGFEGTKMRGSEHNDMYVKKNDGRLGTVTNRSGGTQGGITHGENIYFRIAFKPPATIAKAQDTCNMDGGDEVLAAKGRHDPCVVNRAVPIVEAMTAITICDAILLQKVRDATAAPRDWGVCPRDWGEPAEEPTAKRTKL